MPFLVVSPWARANYVDSLVLDQSSVVKFIEFNWHLPAMGNGASDAAAGSINLMFNFNHPQDDSQLFLNPANGAISTRH